MARVSTYLNFQGNTEQAFNFYKSIFEGEFLAPGLSRYKNMTLPDGLAPLPEKEQNLVMHVELEIIGGHILMASDSLDSMGYKINFGNNSHINLELDSKDQMLKLFKALSQKGQITQEPADMFWGTYYGSCIDQFGVNWMFNFIEK